MKKNNSTLLSSFDILHSSFLIIFLIFYVDVAFTKIPGFLAISILPAVAFALNIFLFAGVFGTLIDLITEKIPAVTLKAIFKNAKKFFLTYLLLVLLKITLNFLYISLLKLFQLKPQYIVAHFDTLILFLASFLIISKKNFKLTETIKKSRNIPVKEILIIVFLHFLNEILLNNKLIFPINKNFLVNNPFFLFIYTQLLTFIYLSKLILENYSFQENNATKQKELYLISPADPGVLTSITSKVVNLHPPIFVVLKALTPKNYKIKEFRRVTWKKRFFKGGKLVAITSFTSNSPEAYKIAKGFKKCGSKVIMGGPHVSFLPNEALKYCDSVVIGDADGVWETIIHDYENNALKDKYYGCSTEGSREKIHQELLSSPPDIIRSFLETTSGCKFRCFFCSIPSIKGAGIKKKPISEVVDLISKINRKNKSIVFLDNNIFVDPDYAKELFKALIPFKIKWGSQCSIDIAKDNEALSLAKKSGCLALLIGYETYCNSKESARKGKFAYAQEYLTLTKKIKRTGIQIKAHFIYGFDSDNLFTAFDIFKFAFQINPLATCLSLLTPIPGSQFFYKMIEEKRIINFNWRNYDFLHLTFQHKSMNNFMLFSSFTVLRYVCLLTTCKSGYLIIFLILFDTIFRYF